MAERSARKEPKASKPKSPPAKGAAGAPRRKPVGAAAAGGREQALFEQVPVALHEIDLLGFIRRVNPAECALLGFEPGDLVGRHISDFVDPAAREASREAVRRKLAGELPLTPFSREFRRKDGVRLLLEIHENHILDETGAVAGIRSALLDVSVRHRAQEESHRTQEELEARVRRRTEELGRTNQKLESEIAERRRAEQRLAVQYGVARVVAEAGTLEAAVPKLLEQAGEHLGCEMGGWWTPDPQGRSLRGRAAWSRGGDSVSTAWLRNSVFEPGEGFPAPVWTGHEPAWVDLSSERGWVAAEGVPCCGLAFPVVTGSETIGVMAFFYFEPRPRDEELLRTAALLGSQIGQFAERKGAETARANSEARFTVFMDNLPGVAFLKDSAGRYVYFNAGVRLLTEREPEALLNRRDEEIWPPEIAAAAAAQERQVLETGRPVESLQQLPGPQGAPRFWLVYKFPVPGPEGGAPLIGGVALDVTERQLLENKLHQSQKMDAVGRVAGGVAHDFNNLLTIIGGYGRMVLDQLPDGGRARGSMEQVLNAADRAAVLTSQLLAFSRRQVAQRKIIELNHVVSNLEKMLRRVIGEHISLRTSFDPRLARVKADAGQVEQVLMNLAINARDAMPEGGTLTIETANAVLRGLSHIRLSVIDSGTGMDAHTRSRIFEPFFTTKSRGKGTGLGLSTVYGIVKQHGGEVVVESEPGSGARFHIYLPVIADEAEADAPESKSESPGGGSETILLVEDEDGVRRVARDTLRSRGYRVLEAADGREALRLAEAETGRIHILVTDMIMPLMSGRELARRLQERDRNMRVVFMSGYTDDVIAYHGELGADADFLQKPFAPDVLARKVRTVLDTGRNAAKAAPRGRS